MAIQNPGAFEQLRAHHLPNLSDEGKEVMGRRLSGETVASIALDLVRSQGVVRRHIEKIQDAIFIPLALSRDQWATAFWASAHLECCLGATA